VQSDDQRAAIYAKCTVGGGAGRPKAFTPHANSRVGRRLHSGSQPVRIRGGCVESLLRTEYGRCSIRQSSDSGRPRVANVIEKRMVR